MANNKATEQELEGLHKSVAKVLNDHLVEKTTIEDDNGTSTELEMVNTQVLGQAIKFLKDNNVTATPEVGDDLNDLADLLKDKPKKGRSQLRAVPAKAAASEE